MIVIVFIIIGAIFVNVGVPEFKEELNMVDELPVFKRGFMYIATFVGFLSFDNYLGWLFIGGRDIIYILWRGFYSTNLLLI